MGNTVPDSAATQDALATAAPGFTDQALELIQAGGPVVIILLAMSVAALAIVLAKLWQFHAARLWRRGAVRQSVALWRTGRRREALGVVDGARDPLAQIVALAMRGRMAGAAAEAAAREEVMRVGSAAVEGLRGGLRALELIAALSPLLGLFGTVIGMIDAFRALEQAGSRVDPAILSGGIWVALLTTAVGLAVAIPAVAALTGLERSIERATHAIEDAVTAVFTATPQPAEELPREHVHLRPAGAAAGA
ncbi:MAG: MotA/TolQ/ExbB proton channel family protein [Alphaproteobacteria bacterium]